MARIRDGVKFRNSCSSSIPRRTTRRARGRRSTWCVLAKDLPEPVDAIDSDVAIARRRLARDAPVDASRASDTRRARPRSNQIVQTRRLTTRAPCGRARFAADRERPTVRDHRRRDHRHGWSAVLGARRRERSTAGDRAGRVRPLGPRARRSREKGRHGRWGGAEIIE